MRDNGGGDNVDAPDQKQGQAGRAGGNEAGSSNGTDSTGGNGWSRLMEVATPPIVEAVYS